MRVRLLALLSAAVLFVLGAVPAAASEDHGDGGNHGNPGYLALGDSVAFGYDPLIAHSALGLNPENFVGYPEIVARSLDLNDVNASCPGETTAGLISRTAANDFGCLPFVNALPLHVNYSTSQLPFAIHYLKTHHNVRLVTMDIGGNDVFKLQTDCGGATTVCFAQGINGVLAGIDANLQFIYGQIRNVAHYHHALVTLTYYSAFGYDPVNGPATAGLNAFIIDATLKSGGIVADGYEAFHGPAGDAVGGPCAAGLLLPAFPPAPPACDIHPSPAGRDLLAAAVVTAVAASCSEHDAEQCLSRHDD